MPAPIVDFLVDADGNPVKVEADSLLIHIGTKNAAGAYELSTYPQRSTETTIYHTAGAKPSASKPREVRWVAHDLEQGETLKIERKATATAALAQAGYTIKYPGNTTASGGAQQHPNGVDLHWRYSITLRDAAGTVLASLDPDVIVKDDP